VHEGLTKKDGGQRKKTHFLLGVNSFK